MKNNRSDTKLCGNTIVEIKSHYESATNIIDKSRCSKIEITSTFKIHICDSMKKSINCKGLIDCFIKRCSVIKLLDLSNTVG